MNVIFFGTTKRGKGRDDHANDNLESLIETGHTTVRSGLPGTGRRWFPRNSKFAKPGILLAVVPNGSRSLLGSWYAG